MELCSRTKENPMMLKFFQVVSIVFLPLFSLAQNAKRVVIVDSDLAKVESLIASEKGILHKHLKYQNGLVASLSEPALKKLNEKFPRIRIEEDFEVKLLGAKISGRPSGGTVQPAQVVPWGIAAIQAPQAHAHNRGAGVVVCVVDTGIQSNHPDLLGQVVGGENFVIIKGKINPEQHSDDNGHGTHVAGTIAALQNSIGVVGVAPEAKLLAMKVLNRQGSGYTSDVAEGVRACAAKGAQILSMSLGSASDSTLLREAVQEVAAAGLKIVAAAGNEATQVSYPAAYPEALAISAVDAQGGFASFSNFGPEVDYAAPGVSVYSTTYGSSYATYSGTSMATPHAAGVIALELSSESLGLRVTDIGLSPQQQGLGFINALLTVTNF